MTLRDECRGCELGDALARREFLRDIAHRALLAAGVVGLAAPAASAMEVAAIGGGLRSGADKAYPIPASDGAVIDKDESVIIARVGGKVFAFSLACPHQNTAIRWEASNNRFQCPKHRSRYQPDGVFIEGRATRSLDRFAVRREGSNIVVNFDQMFMEDRNPAAWAAAFITL